jgi:hypothetical protein
MIVKDIEWREDPCPDRDNLLCTFYSNEGHRITVVDRMTGFGWRDTETGLLTVDGEWWLASGRFDIREYSDLTVEEAIEKIKENANTCVPK